MAWGNMKIVEKVENKDGSLTIRGELMPDDKDFKKTKKVSWLPNKEDLLCSVTWVEYDHLIKVPKVRKGMKIEDIYKEKTKFTTEAWAEA